MIWCSSEECWMSKRFLFSINTFPNHIRLIQKKDWWREQGNSVVQSLSTTVSHDIHTEKMYIRNYSSQWECWSMARNIKEKIKRIIFPRSYVLGAHEKYIFCYRTPICSSFFVSSVFRLTTSSFLFTQCLLCCWDNCSWKGDC